jgi:hypothetical protein
MNVRMGFPASTSIAPSAREMVLLETLKSLLDTATQSLGAGDAAALLDVSRRISLTAQEFGACIPLPGSTFVTAEVEQRRRRLLVDVSQQLAFCRAMLRRWRRSLAVRQQLLDMSMDSVVYQPSLRGRVELR